MNHNSTIILVTNSDKKENIIKHLATKRYKKHHDEFKGEEIYICFKLEYTAPYDEFNGIKKLILRIKDSTGLRDRYKGFVAIDINEWVGHENEEYFNIFLKYIHDHLSGKQYIFIVDEKNSCCLDNLIIACMRYLNIEIKKILEDKHKISSIDKIKVIFSEKKIHMKNDALELLVNFCSQEKNIDLTNEYVLYSLANDIQKNIITKVIDKNDIISYSHNPNTILNILTKNKIGDQENEYKQL